MTLSQQLIARLRSLQPVAIPLDVRDAARLHFLDAIGVGFAAAATGAGAPYLKAAPALSGNGPATVFGSDEGFTAAAAALANGGMIHGLEYDDTHTASIVHGSSVLAAAALAAAESTGASNDAFLLAYLKGWEVLIRAGLAAPGKFQAQGFQITSVGGTLAAAIVAADLFGLDEVKTTHAIGVALSQSSGVFEFLTNGSTVKSLHAGWAAHGGVTAATLAEAGLTGPATAFEGKFGLFRRFAADDDAAGRFAASIETLGGVWHLPQAAFKFYPCCHYIHPFIEALEIAVSENPNRPIQTIVCEVPPGATVLISDPWEHKLTPQSGHEARYSLPIALAARLVEGSVTPATFTNAPSTEIVAQAKRISAREMVGADFPNRFEARIHVTFADGDTRQVYVEDVFGGVRRPPSREAVLQKFRANLSAIGAERDVRALEDAVLAGEDKSITELTRALRRVRRATMTHAAE
ncbi:MAG: MmgE/PrpD family protein [Xanthobacteraceae bacterium]